MDRRQNRTRKAIFQAMAKLLPQKHFEHITVQEIIDEADIGRSTFYTHFETKDELLRSMCSYFFNMIRFQAQMAPEAENKGTLEIVLTQVLIQAKAHRQILLGMYAGETGGVCGEYIQEELRNLFQDYVTEVDTDIPERFVICYLADGFGCILRRFLRDDIREKPEDIVSYYLKLTRVR